MGVLNLLLNRHNIPIETIIINTAIVLELQWKKNIIQCPYKLAFAAGLVGAKT
jgi:hypothetical protein